MRFTQNGAKARPKKVKPARRKQGAVRGGVSAKASNWLHAQVRTAKHRPRTILLAIFSGLVSTVILGLTLSGHMDDSLRAAGRFMDKNMLAMGFRVEHVDISGNSRVRRDEIMQALGVETGEPVFRVDLQAARTRVEALGWVQRAMVARLLPNRISVVVQERIPYARWQQNGKLQLIDAKGVSIASIRPNEYAHLPLIVGQGANIAATPLVSTLQGIRPFAGNVSAMVRVSGRRWNVQMRTGAEVMLPAQNPTPVLQALAANSAFVQMLQIPDAVIDARVDGEIAIRHKGEQATKRLHLMS